MKVAIIVPVLLAASLSAAAQATRPLLEVIGTNKPLKKTAVPLTSISGKAVQPQAKLLTTTAAGKIYALPLDNMPCLVPNETAVIQLPVALQPRLKNNIPNGSVAQPVIPQNK
jgi:hypothetical protein